MNNFKNKADINQIRKRFDVDVERFSNLETGQKAAIDAPLLLELITQAAASVTPHAKRVLDIGCGAGNNTLKLLERINPIDCDLLDISLPMLERAKDRVSAVNLGKVSIIQSDIREAELSDSSYDIILAAAVLHHLRDDTDWEQVFSTIYRLTAPGGSVWISDLVFHEHDAIQQMMYGRYGDYLESVGGKNYRKEVFDYIDEEDSPRSVVYQLELLKKVGFSQVDIIHKNSCFALYGAIK